MQKRRTKNKRRYQRQIIEFTHSQWNPGIGTRNGETFVGQGQSTTRIPHSHTHISTDRHMYCMPLYESNKPNHVYIYAKITLARRVPVMLRLWLCICICVSLAYRIH